LFGNTSNGSVLLALNHAIRNRIRKGEYGIMFGVGVGFDFAYTLLIPDRDLVQEKVVKILLADDDEGVLETKVNAYKMFLDNHKEKPENVRFEYHTAKTGEEAIKMAKEINPDILDFDMRMPGLNGARAATLIHEAIGAKPTIINSAYSDEQDLAEYDGMKLTQFKDYVVKTDKNPIEYANFVIDFLYKSNVL